MLFRSAECGGGANFRPIEPAKCKAAGYSVGDWAYRDFNQNYNDGYNEDNREDFSTTIYLDESTEEAGKYDFRIVDTEDGVEETTIFPKVKLGGFGKEFALIGKTLLDPTELKAQVAEEFIREQIRRLSTGDAPPPPPSFNDPWCDPLNIMNNINAELGYDNYTTQSVLPDIGFYDGGGSWKRDPQRPLCSALDDDSNALQLVEDFCYDKADDGSLTLKTTLTSHAALAFCWAVEDGEQVNFWEVPVKDLNGDGIKSCILEYNDENQIWRRIELSDSQEDCEKKMIVGDWDWQKQAEKDAMRATIISEQSLNENVGDMWVRYETIKMNMQTVCSKLRTEDSVNLQVCYNHIDKELEPDRQEDWETVPGIWDTKLNEADAEIETQKANNGGYNALADKRRQIDQCVSQFDQTVKELDKRKADINAIKKAVEIINTSVNSDGTKKYVKDSLGNYQKRGEFAFLASEMTKLDAILTKAEAAMTGWKKSINVIKGTYAKLKNALVKADQEDAQKCMPDEIGTQAAFEKIYNLYDLALNGKTDDNANRGVEGWQKASFNHFQCMNYDDNIRKIKEFGLTAPTQGQKDSNKEESTDSLFVTQEGCDGFYDNFGKCVEMVTCKVPSGGATYVTFDDLLAKATIEDGCDEVPEKFAMHGRVLERNETVRDPWGGSRQVEAGTIRAKVLIMTKLPKASCKVTLQFPKLDKDSCFDYKNAAGTSWSSLTDDERSAATASDYTLQYEPSETNMEKLSSRQIVDIALFPNSQIQSSAEKDAGGGDDTLESLLDE